MGMLELDVLVGKWARINVPHLTEQQCHQYNHQVLQKETPDVWNILIQNNQEGR
jgi:succinate dehydrogenase flavin-adding protein (antitoxin of CptAB toxin-antitoxin module)